MSRNNGQLVRLIQEYSDKCALEEKLEKPVSELTPAAIKVAPEKKLQETATSRPIGALEDIELAEPKRESLTLADIEQETSVPIIAQLSIIRDIVKKVQVRETELLTEKRQLAKEVEILNKNIENRQKEMNDFFKMINQELTRLNQQGKDKETNRQKQPEQTPNHH